MDPEHERGPGHAKRFVAVDMRCHSCTEIERHADNFTDSPQPGALQFYTELIDVKAARRLEAERRALMTD
jgi:hypothetical protein